MSYMWWDSYSLQGAGGGGEVSSKVLLIPTPSWPLFIKVNTKPASVCFSHSRPQEATGGSLGWKLLNLCNRFRNFTIRIFLFSWTFKYFLFPGRLELFFLAPFSHFQYDLKPGSVIESERQKDSNEWNKTSGHAHSFFQGVRWMFEKSSDLMGPHDLKSCLGIQVLKN